MPKLTAISSVKETFNPSKQPSLSLNLTANLVALHETETQTPAGTQETAENARNLLWAEMNSPGTPDLEIPDSLSLSAGRVSGKSTSPIL